ncbi:hypothetical protein CEXT_565791 [Caerostris extrusa]|uniref:Uncharacterized protein n=1 Tax=Caerostris extrusa TaxID=172846 RepID=A0AAV4NA23_CAEEX|nr:hypothetical protein CEXT_565791 [Caerostris extrusa]
MVWAFHCAMNKSFFPLFPGSRDHGVNKGVRGMADKNRLGTKHTVFAKFSGCVNGFEVVRHLLVSAHCRLLIRGGEVPFQYIRVTFRHVSQSTLGGHHRFQTVFVDFMDCPFVNRHKKYLSSK